MLGFAIRRILMLVPVFLAVSVIIFLMIHMLPGDPIDNLLRIGAGPDQRAALTEKYGLDRPLYEQYLYWIGNVVQGDFGNAIVQRRPVASLIGQALPYSLTLGGLALLVSTVLGITVGIIAASFKGSWLDQGLMGGVLFGSMLPNFWIGLLLILVFSVSLGWTPVSGARGWESLILPVVTIGLGGTALVARVTRVAMIDAQGRDFVMLLHAKGVHPVVIQLRHVLRHALIPVVTILALRIGWILGGAVTVEVVFARPGLGSLLIKSLNQHDYPVVQASLLILAMAVLLGTLLGDLLQAAMDPRIRDNLK
ncbi:MULTISPECIES: ABC transporter permease [Gemmobacter]|jgi:peptide/nickel transport system permease protein/oligopeptide transport system permease protein|uniref:Peptide/nickel transport system permease protein/oligopeptide transport system permease protein n=2 Tax=Gemmobacter TaxID=204456 RepID=A0A2T6AVN4_9RHOB|nr:MULTISPECIES: ABC transporter permease [Gemmobacter]OJY34224.1 MAG: glutathione ABC transporter permease GsiC [Rhodobacterales bacterium 65-51]PTX47857.1 peptide/nickel transport system permease protein/oligopeptide transport system permease protein [Gemmobacter caeni]TWI97421.1 peptide/nickel transport system permease protein/oligopeptide transport system permease protein [Gemmobacter caeni]GHC31193.1 peptide ABC transporter permease [Gemmobacter nanjingensis]